MAEQCNYKVLKSYEDHGQTGTESSEQKEFQKLLVDAKSRTFTKVRRWRTYPVHLFVIGHKKSNQFSKLSKFRNGLHKSLGFEGFLVLVDGFRASFQARSMSFRCGTNDVWSQIELML